LQQVIYFGKIERLHPLYKCTPLTLVYS